ncbi:mannose-binding protein C [Elysia marginata]|uniref:Mannose-binding protein C n=1 Tax=Elysia marginata TaxID=1093978 RepID=A0AAV4H4W1_9GAST|nr:mannose-binding protein C [Elysia marginata]
MHRLREKELKISSSKIFKDWMLASGAGKISVHLGGQDIDTPGFFIWDHSRENLADTHTDWNRGEPNNHGGKEDVVEWNGGTQKWNDIPRAVGFAYICEKAAHRRPIERCSAPPIVFSNAICLVSFTVSSPYTYTAISMVRAESRFVIEYDTSPLDAIPRGMLLGP